ncbi:MAG: lytic transglycosylase domain-containing protein [Roseomonas sp.]|nr:lytic transglycosylase domain-containing protein [Roseomonas sp.]MCA3327716.1 lytic transglycosylase domain-containing protein [Roseomonas sp.]MCA3330725.1 lytic transglycosylase domain-containing protein [Roseomonas sp.]MCA3334214.1 lytic transglycosylase domain-containing protein [Roseomonas sp.]MCA3346344.1 lytic transglycosylase domain-containing protein [Roseomonas sp.]
MGKPAGSVFGFGVAKLWLGLGVFLLAPLTAFAAPDTPASAQRPAATIAAARPAPPALPQPWGLCAAAIAAAERDSGMPAGLLGAIAKVETGRRAPDGSVQPWPWSYNAAGDGRYAASQAEALQEVRALQARGVRSIDIGCMQVNLLHHPAAFPNLEAGFDPATNLAYAVRFLRELRARTGDWNQAVAMYHSATPERGLIYQQRVMAALSGNGFVPGPAPGVIPLPGPAMAGLCASGRGAVMLIGAREPSLKPVPTTPEVDLRFRGGGAPGPAARTRIMCLPKAGAGPMEVAEARPSGTGVRR